MSIQIPIFTKIYVFRWILIQNRLHYCAEGFAINPVCMAVKNPQVQAPVEQAHQVFYKMIVAKDLSNKVYDYI